MTDDELRELVASIALAQKETDRQLQQTDRRLSRQIRELGKQIGGLGEKFGSYTEGLALSSMSKILRRYFKMEVISPSVRVSKDDRHMEIDVLSYANGEINAVCIVEVKSHLREEAIEQMETILQDFRTFFPEHKDKKLYGILAAVDTGPMMRERVLRAGFYLAGIHDRIFRLMVPKGFQPKAF